MHAVSGTSDFGVADQHLSKKSLAEEDAEITTEEKASHFAPSAMHSASRLSDHQHDDIGPKSILRHMRSNREIREEEQAVQSDVDEEALWKIHFMSRTAREEEAMRTAKQQKVDSVSHSPAHSRLSATPAKRAAKQQKVESAKRIAAKVRKLVAVQRHLEEESDVPHTGMVEMQESTDATRKIAEEAKLQMQDSLLTQKLQAKNARKTFKHLMEQEREEQHRALEAERKRSHDVLEAVKKSLQERQQQMIKQMAATEQKVETKLEKTLARTKIAAAIEDVIKRKLSKRVEKLTRAGERVVDGVTGTVNSLKRRVRRLRRSQDRIRNEQSAIQRTVSAEKTAERQYLGESSETEHLRRELKTIRHQLEQRSQPASQQHTQSNMKLENELLKEKLRNAELQNQLMHSTQQPRAAKIEKYSTSTMRNYFNNRRQKEKLAQKVQDEEQNLKMMIVNLKETDNNPKRHDKLARQVQVSFIRPL